MKSFSDLVIKASAGSGKTYQLSNRYLKLLLSGVPVEKILATTFTKKAAGEILDRILMRLGTAALDAGHCADLSKQLFNDPEKLLVNQVRQLLESVIHQFHRLRICTLDSLFMKMAGNLSLELGLPPGWNISEETEIKSIVQMAIQNLFRRMEKSQNNPALALMHLLFKGDIKKTVSDEILSVSMDLSDLYQQSPKEAWEALSFQKEPDSSLLQQTIDLLRQAKIPQDKTIEKSRNKIADLAQDKKWSDIAKETMIACIWDKTYTYNRKDLSLTAPDLVTALTDIIEFAKADILNKLSGQTRGTWNLLDSVNAEISRIKRNTSRFNFSDITFLLANSDLSKHREQLVHRLDSESGHLLLDEFQDTSISQWKILDPMVRRSVQSEKGSFFCVGDIKQAIYSWRGGDSRIFDFVSKMQGVKTDTLSDNWRSSPVIIDTVNSIFMRIGENKVLLDSDSKKTEYDLRKNQAYSECAFNWNNRFKQHKYADKNKNLSGCVSFEYSPLWDKEEDKIITPPEDAVFDSRYDPNLLIKYTEKNQPAYTEEETDSEEMAIDEGSAGQEKAHIKYTVRRILELHEQKPGAEIGVLVTKNKKIAKIVTELRRYGICASEEGGVALDIAASVEVILSVLTIADHPDDTVALYHLTAVDGLSKFFHIDETNYSDPQTGNRISLWLRNELMTKGLPAIIFQFACLLSPLCNAREEERLERLLELACMYQEKMSIRFDPFIERVRSEKMEAPGGSNIRVMTIHKSKGLEFDIVVLPDIDSSIDIKKNTPKIIFHQESPALPIDTVFRYINKDEQTFLPDLFKKYINDTWRASFEESLDSLYVAVTRPVRQLVMIAVPEKKEKYTTKNWANIIRSELLNKKENTPDRIEQTDNSKAAAQTDGSDTVWRPDGSKTIWQTGDPDWQNMNQSDQKKTSAAQRIPLFDQKQFTLQYDPDPRTIVMASPRSNAFVPALSDSVSDDSSSISTSRIPVSSSETRPCAAVFSKRSPSHKDGRQWKSSDVYARGTALHLCFEQIRWLDKDEIPQKSDLFKIVQSSLFDETKTENSVQEFYKILENREIRELLSLSSYTKEGKTPININSVSVSHQWTVERERKYSILQQDGSVVRGIIDRLVLLREGSKVIGADIIDYKTDLFADWDHRLPTDQLPDPPSEVAERLKIYAHQLHEYQSAVMRWYQLPARQVSCRCVFVSYGKVFDL